MATHWQRRQQKRVAQLNRLGGPWSARMPSVRSMTSVRALPYRLKWCQAKAWTTIRSFASTDNCEFYISLYLFWSSWFSIYKITIIRIIGKRLKDNKIGRGVNLAVINRKFLLLILLYSYLMSRFKIWFFSRYYIFQRRDIGSEISAKLWHIHWRCSFASIH